MKNFLVVIALFALTSGYAGAQFAPNSQNTKILKDIREDADQLKRDSQLMRLDMMQKDSELRYLREEVNANNQASIEMIREMKDRELMLKQSEIDDVLAQNRADAVRLRNTITYLGIFFGYIALIAAFLLKLKRQKDFEAFEKQGVAIVALAMLLPFTPMLLTVDGWYPLVDFLSNFGSANILVGGGIGIQTIIIPIRYLGFLALTLMLYGVLVYINAALAPSVLIRKIKQRS